MVTLRYSSRIYSPIVGYKTFSQEILTSQDHFALVETDSFVVRSFCARACVYVVFWHVHMSLHVILS